MVTEREFYESVAKACNEAGISDTGRSYVEMTCLDNADIPSKVWEMALDTLKWFVATNQLHAASRNEL